MHTLLLFAYNYHDYSTVVISIHDVSVPSGLQMHNSQMGEKSSPETAAAASVSDSTQATAVAQSAESDRDTASVNPSQNDSDVVMDTAEAGPSSSQADNLDERVQR